jgi:hypothetical protein
MPDSPLRQELSALGARVDVQGTLGTATAPAKLGASLASKLGAFAGKGAPSLATRDVRELRVPVVVREYTSGKRRLRVKITDTTDLPAVRQELVDQLTQIGDATTGNQHGLVLRGIPAIAAYHEHGRISRASLLAGGRYLVEIMVHDTDAAEDALRVAEAMNLGALVAKKR